MTQFESVSSYWLFASYIKEIARHILNGDQQAFLKAVIDTAVSRKTLVNKGSTFWRAQLGNAWNTNEHSPFKGPRPYPIERMIPQPRRAREGRINPKGIACVYCATDATTAIGEVRPWIGSYVSVAEIVAVRDVEFVDCSKDPILPFPRMPGEDEPAPALREAAVWAWINFAFSKPVTDSDDVADYAPTQVLAEVFRLYGYGGIIYTSRVGTGKTVAFFDTGAVKCGPCTLHSVSALKIEHREHKDVFPRIA